jgi:hypothetical protein
MEDELRLLRQAHDEQARRLLAERVVAADRVRGLELRAEELERQTAEAKREAADAGEDARQHVEAALVEARRNIDAALWERDAARRDLESFRATRTYRMLTLVHEVLSRRSGRSK